MFEAHQLLLYTLAAFALVITPGPDMMYVMTVSVGRGSRAGVLSAAGVSTGVLVHTLMVSLGLAVLLQTSAVAYNGVKMIGGAYLIYLGVEALRNGSQFRGELHTETLSARGRGYFVRGMVSNIFNPKVALFFLTFLPQFVAVERGNPVLQMVTLGLIYAAIAIVMMSMIAMMSGSVSGWLRRSPRVADALNTVMGSVFLLLGLRLLWPEARH